MGQGMAYDEEEKDAGRVHGFRLGAAVFVALLALVIAAPAGDGRHQSTIIAPQHMPRQPDDGWQAGTCKIDTPRARSKPNAQFFEQAAGHPPVGFTQIIVKQHDELRDQKARLATSRPSGSIFPTGLSVNPQATPQCELEGEQFPDHPLSAPILRSATARRSGRRRAAAHHPAGRSPDIAVYNLKPRDGEPARFGFSLPRAAEVFLQRRRRMGGRLPRVLHDPRAESPRPRPEDPPRTAWSSTARRQRRRRRDLPDHAQHLLRPEPAGLRKDVYSTFFTPTR